MFITIFYVGICIAQNRSVDSNITSLGPKNHPAINSPNKWNNSQTTSELKYKFQQIGNSQGLSNSSINTIFQDSDNLLWIGTWDGLNRYDGSKFKIFRPELNNENSLSNQVILKIDEDKSGQIWVSTIHGINSYDKETNNFRRYYFTRINNPPVSESEFNMALDATKTVYCAVKDWGTGYFYKDGIPIISQRKL